MRFWMGPTAHAGAPAGAALEVADEVTPALTTGLNIRTQFRPADLAA